MTCIAPHPRNSWGFDGPALGSGGIAFEDRKADSTSTRAVRSKGALRNWEISRALFGSYGPGPPTSFVRGIEIDAPLAEEKASILDKPRRLAPGPSKGFDGRQGDAQTPPTLGEYRNSGAGGVPVPGASRQRYNRVPGMPKTRGSLESRSNGFYQNFV